MSLLCLSVSFFIRNPSLSISSPFLSLSLCLTLYYTSLSNHVIWHFSHAFSLGLFSSSLSFYLSGFSLFIPLSCPVSPFFSLWPASLRSVTLPELLTHMHARVHSHSHMHRVTETHTGTPWLRLAGLFELCGIALRDCVRLCMWHVWCVLMCVHMLMGMCVCLHVWQRVPPEVWNRGFEADAFVTGLQL